MRDWHLTDIARCPKDARFGGQSRHELKVIFDQKASDYHSVLASHSLASISAVYARGHRPRFGKDGHREFDGVFLRGCRKLRSAHLDAILAFAVVLSLYVD
jgi:hypothetical protein